MYFHSSSSRHERYEVLRRNRVNSTKKLPSFTSNTSGVDSGYNSSTSTSPTTEHSNSTTDPTSSIVSEPAESTASSVTTLSAPPRKKQSNRTKQHQPPRNPDLVYSCPRPLAFPFHNDCHFLPVAEADPRDVARMHGTPSVASSKASSTTYDQESACHSIRSGSSPSVRSRSESTASRATSFNSSQQGTVQSLRSLFTSASKTDSVTPSDRLPRLEIKKGTVQSLREIFSSAPSTSPTSPQPPNKGRGFVDLSKAFFSAGLGLSRATDPSSPSSSTSSTSSISSSAYQAVRNLFRRKPKSDNINETSPLLQKKSTPSIFSNRSWFGRKETPKYPDTPPDQLPQPVLTPPSSPKSIKSAIKSFFTSRKSGESAESVETSGASSPSRSRRSFFSFSRSKSDEESTKPTETSPTSPSTVGRLWKGFKSIMGAKKTSRVD
ncbi:hypothetical protein DFQ30_002330, partial [Apophysomyces sp. BC1015]